MYTVGKERIIRLVNAKIDDIISELQRIRKEYWNLTMKDNITINLDTMPMKVKERLITLSFCTLMLGSNVSVFGTVIIVGMIALSAFCMIWFGDRMFGMTA